MLPWNLSYGKINIFNINIMFKLSFKTEYNMDYWLKNKTITLN